MARLASLAHPIVPVWTEDSTLAGDRIDFDAWLLPPDVPSRSERTIRFCSTVAGPLTFFTALACVIGWIV
jgi:hypothetical protein